MVQIQMLSFQELVTRYTVPEQSLFHHFRLRSALKSHNIQWGDNLKLHLIVELVQNSPKRIASSIYLNQLKWLKSQDFLLKNGKKTWQANRRRWPGPQPGPMLPVDQRIPATNLSIIRLTLEPTGAI